MKSFQFKRKHVNNSQISTVTMLKLRDYLVKRWVWMYNSCCYRCLQYRRRSAVCAELKLNVTQDAKMRQYMHSQRLVSKCPTDAISLPAQNYSIRTVSDGFSVCVRVSQPEGMKKWKKNANLWTHIRHMAFFRLRKINQKSRNRKSSWKFIFKDCCMILLIRNAPEVSQ